MLPCPRVNVARRCSLRSVACYYWLPLHWLCRLRSRRRSISQTWYHVNAAGRGLRAVCERAGGSESAPEQRAPRRPVESSGRRRKLRCLGPHRAPRQRGRAPAFKGGAHAGGCTRTNGGGAACLQLPALRARDAVGRFAFACMLREWGEDAASAERADKLLSVMPTSCVGFGPCAAGRDW